MEADFKEQARIEYMDDCLYGIFAMLGADVSVFKPFGAMYAERFESGSIAKEPTGREIMNDVKARLKGMIAAASDGGEIK